MARMLAGHAAVGVLKILRRVSPCTGAKPWSPLLAAYALLRPGRARHLRRLFAASPFKGLTVSSYYRARLELLGRCLHVHGRELRPDEMHVQGAEHYQAALSHGKPVVLLGLHLGAVEFLHRLPSAPTGRPFRVLTAPAFSPPLTEYMAWGRERDGKQILRNDVLQYGLREILRGKGILAMMADQHPGKTDDFIHLWDRISVPYPARLLRFLAGHGCLALPVSTYMEADGMPSYRFHPIWEAAECSSPGALAVLVKAFMEEAIARAPEQWNWSYHKLKLKS